MRLRVTAAAGAVNWLVLEMGIGAPVHCPYHHRNGVPASSHSSMPVIDHAPPDPFVQFGAVMFDVDAEDAEFHVITVRAYPDPVSSVIAVEAVGAFDPRYILMPVVAWHAVPRSPRITSIFSGCPQHGGRNETA